MAELSIRRNREIATPQYQKMGRAEKKAAVNQVQIQAQRPANKAAATVSEGLRQLMSRVDQAGRYTREGRRTLQRGEAALAEVQDNLERMEELAGKSAGAAELDRAALQSELEQLTAEVTRIARSGVKAGVFQDGDDGEGVDAMLDAVMDGLSAEQDGVESLPAWLVKGLTGSAPDRAALLAALGVDSTASGAEILAALGNLPLDSDSAAGYLAALYLGSVISTGSAVGPIDLEQAAEGLRQLLEAVAEGASPDQVIELLTGGVFTGLEDFQAQFSGGTAPGLETFLMDLLFSQDAGDILASIMDLLAASGGGDMEMLMDLLAMMGGSGDGLLDLLDGAGISAEEGVGAQPVENGTSAAQPQMETTQLGTVQASGRDVSGAAFDPEAGVVTVEGTEDLVLRGMGQEGQEAPEIRLAGEGTVTLQQVDTPALTAQATQSCVVSAGENEVALLQLEDGTTLTLEGGGLLRVAQLRAGAHSVLRLAGGAVVLTGEQTGTAASLVMDGPAVLLAPDGTVVLNAQGKPLTPFDIVWKTLLPEWSAITSMAVDGKQEQLMLKQEDWDDPVRLWLLKRDSDQKEPTHTIMLRGRDKAGRLTSSYIYVRWDEKEGGFQEISMYPNPFTVTGGEPGVDWIYEEETHTLRILTAEVTAISGGAGTDSNQVEFSGRIALADGIGRVALTLDGVECKVSTGRAFDLGRGNDVTLLLQRGTENVFESGPGCAGLSMGDGTSLCVDQVKGARGEPEGILTATGGAGGAGIGRDSGAGRELTGAILIKGGVVTAIGTGGGAGIGGALGAPVADIRIQGGMVTAQASCCAAAIGAGIQGSCGDITITGTARVMKAQGGGPDGDIGGCLLGNCGKVQVSAGTDIGGAKLWTQKGLSLQMGETSVTFPKFRVSARSLRLDGLDISTREAAKAAMEIIVSDRRWVTRLQGAYGAMYGQLAQSFGGMYNVHRHFSVVRDNNEASSLTCDIREVLRLSPRAQFLKDRGMEDVGQLLR